MWNATRFNTVRWNKGSSYVPPTPSIPSLDVILLNLMAQIESKEVFPPGGVGLSLTQEPSSHIIANAYATITPGREMVIEGQSYGLGRWGTGMESVFFVNIYCRLALDIAYQDTLFLTDNEGLRPLVFGVVDALQLYLPVDENGFPLAEEPVRILGNRIPRKYRKSGEWGYISIPYSLVYSKPCDTDFLV